VLGTNVTPFPVNDLKDRRKQAILRCREHVAFQLYGRDFSILSRHDQNRIIQMVQVTVATYDLADTFTPLPVGCARRAELEPELVREGRAS
jgi:hypothetical protein